jgi:hypothetical protein
MKKTALDWFLTEFKKQVWFEPDSELDIWINKLIPEAKEMEMKHLAQAFEDGEHNYFYSKKTGKDFKNGIEYYNEKFKKDEQ